MPLETFIKKYMVQGFPGGPIKNPPCNARDISSMPGLGDPTCCGATKLTCPNYWASTRALLSSTAESSCSTEPQHGQKKKHK